MNRLFAIFVAFWASMSLGPASAQGTPEEPAGGPWTFSEQAALVDLDYTHFFDTDDWLREWHIIAGGLAIGDLNNDGWDDIFAVTGHSENGMGQNTNPNKLFISDMDGTYTESAADWGLSDEDILSAGPLIVDINGDGWNDLLVGGVVGNSLSNPASGHIKVYLNTGLFSFADATLVSGLKALLDESLNFGMAASDIEKDNDLDLFVTHWADSNEPFLLENNGSAVFSDISSSNMNGPTPHFTFTPTFADINNDGSDDLLLNSDFLNDAESGGGSRYFLNNGSGSFNQQDPAVLTDENGMGGAVADYDNDSDLDWFSSSIYDSDGVTEANWGVSGNRLYRNDGTGTFTDVTGSAGVRIGFWGWGACFADFNNDMHLDLYHVNGFPEKTTPPPEDEFAFDPARMFINDGDNSYTEMAASLNVDDNGQGRAILCFDSDRDGDLDILVNNNLGPSRYFENNLDNSNHWIEIKLVQPSPNHEAIGAKIFLTAGGVTQMRQIYAGGNFGSSHPTAQHFGLADQVTITSIAVTWPDGSMNIWSDVPADQYLILNKTDDTLFEHGFE